jgi:hypothetical protein
MPDAMFQNSGVFIWSQLFLGVLQDLSAIYFLIEARYNRAQCFATISRRKIWA